VVQKTNRRDEANRYENESEQSLGEVQPHVLGQVLLREDQFGKVVVLLEMQLEVSDSAMRVLAATNVGPHLNSIRSVTF